MSGLFPPGYSFLDNNGDPVASGTVSFYENTTTTDKTIYTDASLSTAATNPQPLNSAGRFNQGRLFGSGTYTIVLKDSSGSQIWSRDDLVIGNLDDNSNAVWATVDSSERFIKGHTASISAGGVAGNIQNHATDAGGSYIYGRFSNDTVGANQVGYKSRATAIGNLAIVQDNDVVTQNTAAVDDGVDYATVIGNTQFRVDDPSPAENAVGGEYVIKTATTSGTITEALLVSSAQEITLPKQPCFLVYASATLSNKTGDSTEYTVVFDTEVTDQGADFSSTTFTAPVGGNYFMQFRTRLSGITAAADTVTITIDASNRDYVWVYSRTNDVPSDFSIDLSEVVDMDASDTAVIKVKVDGEASAVVDLIGASSLQTSFSGCLLA